MTEQKTDMQVCYARYFAGAHRIEAELLAQPQSSRLSTSRRIKVFFMGFRPFSGELPGLARAYPL